MTNFIRQSSGHVLAPILCRPISPSDCEKEAASRPFPLLHVYLLGELTADNPTSSQQKHFGTRKTAVFVVGETQQNVNQMLMKNLSGNDQTPHVSICIIQKKQQQQKQWETRPKSKNLKDF